MKPYHTISTLRTPAQKKTIKDVPERLLTEWSFKLFALMNLAWDYVDTICDLCISIRLEQTKPLVRQVRNLKREYDHFRWAVMDGRMERNETDHGIRFENLFEDDFERLVNGIEIEVNKLDLKPEHKTIVIAVQQALTLMDAVKIYARWCDKEIARHGVWVCDYCMVQTEFLKLFPIIPVFAGDCYQPDIEARRTTSRILANRLREIPLNLLLNENEYTIQNNDITD